MIAGQSFGGDFTVTLTSLTGGGKAVLITVDDLTMDIADDPSTEEADGLVHVTDANNWSGVVLVTPAGIAARIVAGNLTGVFDLGDSIDLDGSVTLEINTAATAVNLSYGDTPTLFSVPPGPYFRITVTGASLKIGTAPDQIEFTGSVTVERSIRAGFDSKLTIDIAETALAAGDLDKDGVLDLVGARATSAYGVLLGSVVPGANGAADTVSYAAPAAGLTPAVLMDARGVVLVDLDNDGWLDAGAARQHHPVPAQPPRRRGRRVAGPAAADHQPDDGHRHRPGGG